MVEVMSNLGASLFVGPQNWLQHHLPWLAVLAMLMGMLRDEPVMNSDPDEQNG